MREVRTGRLMAVGDIHGHLAKLESLMDLVRPTPEDTFVFLGDYIDRGPDSRGVIEYLMEFRNRFPETGTIFLRGNHEQMFLDALSEQMDMGSTFRRLTDISGKAMRQLEPDAFDLFIANGGKETLDGYGAYQWHGIDCTSIAGEHIGFLKETLLYREVTAGPAEGSDVQTFHFVHAGILPGVELEHQDPFDLLWIREPFLSSTSDFGGRIVVHGHTPNPDVFAKLPHRICVDSGVYLSGPVKSNSKENWGKLTCCNVLTREIWQAG